MIRFCAGSERHQDRAHVEQSESEGDTVGVEVADHCNDVAGRNSVESRIIGLSRGFDLREAECLRRTDEKWALAVTLTAGEIVEQTGHSYAPPT